jgi:hypothetical protein
MSYNTTPIIRVISAESTCYNPLETVSKPWYEVILRYLRVIYVWTLVITCFLIHALYKKF